MEENREEETKINDNNIIISFDIGMKNLGCCILEYNNEDDNATIIHWNIHALVDEDRKSKPSINQLSNSIFTEMDKIVSKCSHIDYVLLENQPSRINGTMPISSWARPVPSA